MKIALTLIISLHALIHVLGFLKGFGLAELKDFKQSVSKPMALLWLLAMLMMGAFALTYYTVAPWSSGIGWSAVLLSQLLIFLHWKDAKAGTIGNLVAIYVLLME